ncbi:maternal protein tudor-like isoform X2 [Trichoplusia ni]|uniref:Maternal protein tudor-like isoform X2 n=1 Tax=Trichoplusia ni TaxID=7111 RepID=A0A7E5VZ88_TRINI|nr:maternal protein tudor-like isoform X2 [Trichoplusia ni]
MAMPSEHPRNFRLFVTDVDGEGHFLRISGQVDHQASLMIESLFDAARANLEKGVGAVPPAAIHEGAICAAKYKDGTYYRAKVINTASLSNGLVGVHFIDYGNKDMISLSAIRFFDNYDPLFLQLRGQATDYYLSGVMNPSGRWEEPHLLKLQSLLCYAEYSATVEAQTRTSTIISIQFKGTDLSTHLLSIRFGVAIPLAKQEVLLLQLSSDNQQAAHRPPSFVSEQPNFPEHVPFLLNQNFPSNPASTMRLQQNVSLPFNGSIPMTPSLIGQRLLVNKASRNPGNLRAPSRQPQHAPENSIVNTAAPPPPIAVANKPASPKKSTTFKSRLLEINSHHKVFISSADDGPELFAVQLVNDANKLQDMMDDINKRPHSSLTEPPMIGTVCLGRMSGDRVICRAIVMNLSGSQCKLFFVDFGDTDMVSYYDIFDIPEEFVKPNVFAMRFCLSGVKKLEKGPHLNETFKQLVNGKIMTLKVVAPEGPPLIQYGELYLDNKNVLDLLMANMKDKLQFKWIEMLPLNTRKSVLVSYVDSCIKFYVQLSDKIDDLNAVMEAVRTHCENSSSPGELPVGAACCARFPDDNNWYRARVRDNRGNKVVVTYVDYGNEQEVDVSDLRTITPELIKLPAQALKCALKGFENRPVETKTSNQLEMLALEKTLTATIVGILSSTMIVSLIDETVNPPLDVARRMNQLSQPRSSHEIKATTPVRKDAPESFSSPESVSDDGKKKSFRREKSFKEDKRPPREGNEDFPQRGGSFRGRDNKESFDRAGPGRHSEKFGGRPDRGDRPHNDRRGGGPPRENNAPPQSVGDDEWEDPPAQPAFQPPPNRHNYRERDGNPRDRDNNPRERDNNPRDRENNPRDRENRYNQHDDREERRNDDWGHKSGRENRFERSDRPDRPDRRDNRGDRRDNWGDKKENFHQKKEFRTDRPPRSNFSPRDRAERSFGSDDRKSDKSFRSQDGDRENMGRAPPYKSRSKFTQVQYKELPDPVPLTTQFVEPTVEIGAQHEVSVTWIISPDSFYTQIMSLQPKFLEMMHKIPELYKGVKSYTGDVPVGGSVLARYPVDGVLYRATIVCVQPFSKFIVRYVDFGNKQLVDAKDIWQLDRQLMDLPKMAVHCSLVGVMPMDGEWKADPEIDLCFNAPRYQCVFQEFVEEQYKVSLWNNGASVVDMLVEKQLAKLSEHQTSVTLKDEAIDLTIIVGQQILCKVTHVESYEKFFVQLDLEKAALVEEAIANFDTNKLTPLNAESLADGIHCTLKHDGKIYRAILLEVADTANIKAVLPDYGMTITTALDKLMILPTELSVYYYQSLECSLNNYTAESKTLISLEDLKSKLTGNKVIIYINFVDGISLVSTLYDSITGQKIAIFEPDEGAYDEVVQLCMRSVFNYNFGLAYISHAENLNEFYLQKSTDGDRIAILLDELYKFYEEGTPKPLTSFEEESICVAHSADGNWYRATILSAEDTQVKVQYTDYGNTETLPKESLKILDPKFFEPCALALVASLGLVALQDDALAKLKEWTNEKEVQVTLAFGTDGWLASLHLDGVDLSMKLVNEKLATPQIMSNEEQKVEEPVAEPISLPEGCTQVYISHIDTPGHFWLQMADKVDKIEEIQSELQSNADSYADIDVRELGTICAAKYLADDLWYRAEILDSDSDITTVRFIDYGNTDVLDNQPGLIKVLPDHLKEIERYAVKTSVNAVPTGTGQWSEPSSDYFTQLVGDLANPVDALIVLKDVTTYVDIYVNGQNLTDKLVSEGHASRSEETDCGDLPSCFASHVNSPSEFWIQLETATSELQAMEAAMVDAENFPELTDKEEGVICAAKYPEDGAWYRAQVIVDGSEGTEVLFMDYGNASIANELRSLPDELKVKPALSRKCALQKARDIKWSRKSEIKFNELAAEGATIFNVQFIASGDISIVELYHEGKSVTEELVGLCEESPAERPTPIGQDLLSNGKICYVNSLEEFYVHFDSATSELDKVTVRMNDAPEFEPASELKVGALCAAFWAEDEQWYRARVLEFCDGGYHVQFVDYGNKAKCEEFRQLPEDLAAIEPLSKCCRLSTVFSDEVLHEGAKNKLDELTIEDTTFQIELLDSTKDPILVKLLVNGQDFISLVSPDNMLKKEESLISKAADSTVETANEHSELNTSQADLDESMESNHTVIENKSFETKSDDLAEKDEVSVESPAKDCSTETIGNTDQTLQSSDHDESKDSISTETENISTEEATLETSSEKEKVTENLTVESTKDVKEAVEKEINVKEEKSTVDKRTENKTPVEEVETKEKTDDKGVVTENNAEPEKPTEKTVESKDPPSENITETKKDDKVTVTETPADKLTETSEEKTSEK